MLKCNTTITTAIENKTFYYLYNYKYLLLLLHLLLLLLLSCWYNHDTSGYLKNQGILIAICWEYPYCTNFLVAFSGNKLRCHRICLTYLCMYHTLISALYVGKLSTLPDSITSIEVLSQSGILSQQPKMSPWVKQSYHPTKGHTFLLGTPQVC